MDTQDGNSSDLMLLASNTIRCLALDAVQKANSGHPGMPMGAADMAVVLWLKFLKHNPGDPLWLDRDRFILSAGHGSMLLYSLLHLSGYDISLNQIKQFRQWESITPGHPEYGQTPGVETTTGPLGQGFANGVGMALAERHLAEVFNQTDFPLVDHYTYALVSDGDLMEGISSEAASIAGYLGLGKLIYLYDCNRITIEGTTDLTFNKEDVLLRFKAHGWDTHEIDGHNPKQVEQALVSARKNQAQPSLILAHTHIGYGSPNFADTAKSHGSPLGPEEIRLVKKNLGFDENIDFHVPEEVYSLFAKSIEKSKKEGEQWLELFGKYKRHFPDKAKLWQEYHRMPDPELLSKIIVDFDPSKPIATRGASGECLQKLSEAIPNLIGGSADLAPSTKTLINNAGVISGKNFKGKNIHFGIREHAMGAVMNGISVHGGVIPYGGTFLVFSDYMRPSIRLAALMKLHVIYVFTHDSIFVGEDGPTHQPVEHLAALRCIPELTVIRPADASETWEAWKVALTRKGPTALILTRQKLPVLERSEVNRASGLASGAYIVCGGEAPADILLLASGSEVSLAIRARKILLEKGIKTRVISFPSWEIFNEQKQEYKKHVLPDDIPARLAIEAGRSMGWEKYLGSLGETHGIERFGSSAPGNILAEKYGFTPGSIVTHVEKMLS